MQFEGFLSYFVTGTGVRTWYYSVYWLTSQADGHSLVKGMNNGARMKLQAEDLCDYSRLCI